jgi:hypothetical protein
MAFQVDTSFPILNDYLKSATKELSFLGCFKTTVSNPSFPLFKDLPSNKQKEQVSQLDLFFFISTRCILLTHLKH